MIVVPDDFPSVFAGTEAHERAKKLGEVRVFSERGADDERELIRRVGAATAAVNIRAHARFSDAVFHACPALKLVSVWGTGTDNIDLNAAGMRGVTVCNTPGINAFAVAEHALSGDTGRGSCSPSSSARPSACSAWAPSGAVWPLSVAASA